MWNRLAGYLVDGQAGEPVPHRSAGAVRQTSSADCNEFMDQDFNDKTPIDRSRMPRSALEIDRGGMTRYCNHPNLLAARMP